MKSIQLVLLLFVSAFFLSLCNTAVAQIPTEKLKVKLTDQWVELVGEDSMASFKLTDSSIVNEDAVPIVVVPAVPPAGRTVRQFTPIVVNAVVTKRGNVKRAWIVSSESPYFNKAVLKAVVQWKYQPRIVNGVPQDTLLTIEIPVR
jgi:TonB family protein